LPVKIALLEIAHKSIQRVYLLQNWVEAQSYWAVLFAKTANAIGLLPEKRDTGNLQSLALAGLCRRGLPTPRLVAHDRPMGIFSY
jgi:hypothetical protein